MKSGKERAFWHIQKTPLGEGSLIRNLSFTKFTEYSYSPFQPKFVEHSPAKHWDYTNELNCPQSTIKQLTTMETHRMHQSTGNGDSVLPLRRNLGCRESAQGHKPELDRRGRLQTPYNQGWLLGPSLNPSFILTCLRHLHTPSPVSNSPVMNYMLWISWRIRPQAANFQILSSEAHFFEILEKVFLQQRNETEDMKQTKLKF